MRICFFLISFFLLGCRIASAQNLQAFAGQDIKTCPNSTVVLGNSIAANGGLPPYQYSWSPATGLNSSTVANPTLTATSSLYYVLTVRDSNDSLAYDTVFVDVADISIYTAGRDTVYCPGAASNIVLGNPINASATGCSFSWLPVSGLNNPALPNPIANPTTTTVYTLTVTRGTCSKQTGTVSVSLAGLSISLNFKDTTIKEGQTITLYAFSTATSYSWIPQNGFIHYENTATPEVNPVMNTTYTVIAFDAATGCMASDTVQVIVIPDDELIFYSAFTPNGDGNNDYFYIGNIFKYPDNILKIYNRYGQVIFTSSGYKNDWNGEYQGNKVPTGTYFYILDTGTAKGKYSGSVTILR